MPWLQDGSMSCDTCATSFVWGNGSEDHQTSQAARALGWSHQIGYTNGGDPYEAMLCRGCRTGEKKQYRHGPFQFENTPLWEVEK